MSFKTTLTALYMFGFGSWSLGLCCQLAFCQQVATCRATSLTRGLLPPSLTDHSVCCHPNCLGRASLNVRGQALRWHHSGLIAPASTSTCPSLPSTHLSAAPLKCFSLLLGFHFLVLLASGTTLTSSYLSSFLPLYSRNCFANSFCCFCASVLLVFLTTWLGVWALPELSLLVRAQVGKHHGLQLSLTGCQYWAGLLWLSKSSFWKGRTCPPSLLLPSFRLLLAGCSLPSKSGRQWNEPPCLMTLRLLTHCSGCRLWVLSSELPWPGSQSQCLLLA